MLVICVFVTTDIGNIFSIYARANVFHLIMYLYNGCYLIDDCYRYLVFCCCCCRTYLLLGTYF